VHRRIINRAVLALAARPIDLAPWLFRTKHGEGYFNEQTGQATGWDSTWQRFMARLLAETKITHRFMEHDLRAKCASDAESLERAQIEALLPWNIKP
jgi:hypothetical protein